MWMDKKGSAYYRLFKYSTYASPIESPNIINYIYKGGSTEIWNMIIEVKLQLFQTNRINFEKKNQGVFLFKTGI